MARNTKYSIAKDCRAFLANIEKKGEDDLYHPTVYFDSAQLKWASRRDQGFKAIDLPRGINQFIDVISTIKDPTNIEPKMELMPFMYRELFSEVGNFIYTIQVSGNELKPENIMIIIKWKGVWDDFDIDIDCNNCRVWTDKFGIGKLFKLPSIDKILGYLRKN